MSVLLAKQQISVSEPPFGVRLRGNVCDSSLAGWKVHSRLPIGYNCVFVASSYGCDTYRPYVEIGLW